MESSRTETKAPEIRLSFTSGKILFNSVKWW